MNKSERTSLILIFVTVFIDLLGFGIVLPLLPRYGRQFDASGLTLGLLMASFSAMQFLFAPLWGRISDRIGRRPILILGLAGSMCSYALFGYATSLGETGKLLGLGVLTWLFISRIAAGIAGATISTAQAYIADVTGRESRGKGMAIIGAAFGIGFTFGPLIGAAFVSDDLNAPPSPAPGYVAAVLSGLAMFSALFLLKESLTPGTQARTWFKPAALVQALTRKAVGPILFFMFGTTFTFAAFESTLSLLTKDLGLAQRHNFYVFAYIGFVLTVSQGGLVYRLIGKIGEYRMAVAGVIAMTIGLLLTGFAGQMMSLPVLYAVLPLAVIGYSAVTPSLNSMLSLHSGEDEQGEILGSGQSIMALARIFGPLIGLAIYPSFRALPYWAGAGIMAVAGFFLITILRPQETPQPSE